MRRVYKNLCPASISTSIMAVNMWKNSLKNVEYDNNKILCGTFKLMVSVHHNSVLIKIQPDAAVCRYLFTAKSLYMFRVSQHPSSVVLETVTAASGTGHNTGTATSLRGLNRPRREVAVPEAAVTVFSTPDDGCCDTRNM